MPVQHEHAAVEDYHGLDRGRMGDRIDFTAKYAGTDPRSQHRLILGVTLLALVGLLANSKREDRAVCTGLRNFIRTSGGAFGLIGAYFSFAFSLSSQVCFGLCILMKDKKNSAAGAILSNTLSARLSALPFITKSILASLTSSLYSIDSLNFSPSETSQVLDAYMAGLHYIFIFYAASAGCNLLLCMGIGNTSLRNEQ
jgi:hypothetical protein